MTLVVASLSPSVHDVSTLTPLPPFIKLQCSLTSALAVTESRSARLSSLRSAAGVRLKNLWCFSARVLPTPCSCETCQLIIPAFSFLSHFWFPILCVRATRFSQWLESSVSLCSKHMEVNYSFLNALSEWLVFMCGLCVFLPDFLSSRTWITGTPHIWATVTVRGQLYGFQPQLPPNTL